MGGKKRGDKEAEIEEWRRERGEIIEHTQWVIQS